MVDQKGGLVVILAAGIVLVIITAIGAVAYKEQAERNPSISIINSTAELNTTSLENNQIIKKVTREDAILLPSGAKITVNSFVYQVPNEGQAAPEIKHFDQNVAIDKHLVIFHQGYTYDITRSDCISKPHLDIDYVYPRLEECLYSVKATKQAPPSVSYNISKSFSSGSDQQAPRDDKTDIIQNSTNESFYRINPPYLQLYLNSGSKKYEFASPGFIVVETAYGSETFDFKTPDELLKNTSQTKQIGPLTITLNAQNHSCFTPYMQTSGECNKPGDPPVYNKFDFNLKIEQISQEPQPIQIIDSS